MSAARSMTDAELLAEVRAIVRDEAERLEARLRGQRLPGQRRVKSAEMAARIAEERAGTVDDLARSKGAAAVARLRRRMGG